MGKVVVDISMSLDGFIAGPNDTRERPLSDGGDRLHAWMFSGTTASRFNRRTLGGWRPQFGTIRP